ncbi:MAG: DUF2779 domain-containing protein [Porticoccaceae bacterium]
MTPPLSKSRIQSGRQCEKRLWLDLHDASAAHWGPSAQTRLDQGTAFGELARELLGDGVLIEADHRHVREALAETAALLAKPVRGAAMLFEAAFEHQNVRVRVDALKRHAGGDTLIEVKSTTQVKPEHLWDCAIQTWVAEGAGRRIRSIQLGHIDNRFVYRREGDYRGLLILEDVTTEVRALLPEIPAIVARLKAVASGAQPDIRTGPHCTTPYGCPFIDHCRGQEPAAPDYPVELLPRAPVLIQRLIAAGYRDLRKVPAAALANPRHRRILAATKTGRTYRSPELDSLLAGIPFPRHYLDFETIRFIIPRWLGTRPFEQLPFQFSCHIESANGALRHREFLDASGDSPLADFVQHLLQALRGDGPILVWSQGFEGTRLRELAQRFPEHGDALHALAARIIDLLPIYREHYYHRDMLGSWSIKAVLPTIAPDLAYDDLSVADGNAAQDAYLQAIHPDTHPTDRQTLQANLLAYCRRDTLAMVRLARPA